MLFSESSLILSVCESVNILISGALLDEPCECTGMMSPNIILGLVVWAVLLTLMIVILLVVASKNVRQEMEAAR